jgi:hypothetical protein
MRSTVAFVLTFVLALAILVWLSEELRVLPRGPGWLLLCIGLAAWSARYFRTGGAAHEVGAAVAAAVSNKLGAFSAPSASDEEIWACAAHEFEGPQRRPGLYAKALAMANGDAGKAKAFYLKARVAEAIAQAHDEPRQQTREVDLANLSESERREALVPKGVCPSCDAVIPLASTECTRCPASFGEHSAWSVKPLREA